MELVKETVEKIKGSGRGFEREIREQTLGYIIASLGIVAGLAWNEAMSALIEYLFPLIKNTLLAKLLYAVIVTAIAVVFSSYVLRKHGGGESSPDA